MDLTEKLFVRNKQLEIEKVNLKEDIRQKVQNSGFLVQSKFKSFGGSDHHISQDSVEIKKADADLIHLQK